MDKWLETGQIPVHVVSAGGLVQRDGRILLIRSERRGWEFPGGIVEQGEGILEGLKREILEESGVTAEAERVTGIYQNLLCKKGFGPLEGVTLPTTVSLVFLCRYVSGEAAVTDACVETGWFTPEEAGKRITHPYMRKAFEDACQHMGKTSFATFRLKDQEMELMNSACL